MGVDADDIAAAQRSLDGLARSWGHEAEVRAESAQLVETDCPGEKAVDPVAVAALIVSLLFAALAVHDLVDRIRNRKRAKELIDQAVQLATRQVTVRVVLPDRTVELPD